MKPSSTKSSHTGTARRITANFVSLLTSEVISKLIQFAIFVYLARFLGKEDFGIFSFGLAFAFIFVLITDFGLNHLFVREISRDKGSVSKFVSNGIMLKIALSVLTLLATHLTVKILDYGGKTKVVAYLMVIFAIIQSFNELNFSVFRAFQVMRYEMAIKISRMIILSISIFSFVKYGYGLYSIVLSFIAAELAMLVFSSLIVYSKFAKFGFRFDFNFSRSLLKESSLFFFSTIFSNIYLYIDQVMLSKMKSTGDVGLYSAAANLTIALVFIPAMYGQSIFPVISKLFVSSRKSMKFAYERSIKYMLVLGVPISAGIFALAERIVSFFYGSQYALSAPVLAILSGYLLLKFLNPISGFTLMAMNRQGSRLFSHGMAALINVILNLILIPRYGIIGAAYATLITEIIFFCLYTSFISRMGFGYRFMFRFAVKPLISAAVMIFLVYFIENLFFAIFAGGLVYLLLIYLLNVLDNDDKKLLAKILDNR